MSNSCFIRSLSAWVVKSICPVRSCAHQVPAEETAGKWIMLRWWAAVYLPVDSQSLFVCSAEWKKEKTALKHRGVYSIPLIKTNRNQNMSGCVLCQLMVLCVFRLQLKIWRTTSGFICLIWSSQDRLSFAVRFMWRGESDAAATSSEPTEDYRWTKLEQKLMRWQVRSRCFVALKPTLSTIWAEQINIRCFLRKRLCAFCSTVRPQSSKCDLISPPHLHHWNKQIQRNIFMFKGNKSQNTAFFKWLSLHTILVTFYRTCKVWHVYC